MKLELHCHTQEVSPCGKLPAAELVERYHQCGYDGIVITDHYYQSFLDRFEKTQDLVSAYLAGYRAAKKAAEQYDMKVYLGMEYRRRDHIEDILIYGVEESWIAIGQKMLDWTQEELYFQVHQRGMVMYQAHPYRKNAKPLDIRYLDGIEAFNVHPKHNSRNYLAVRFAKGNGLSMIAGSDCHDPGAEGRGGIEVEKMPENNHELVDLLQQQQYRLIY